MENQKIRLLLADEIEGRAAAITEKGLYLLLYKDARVDQRILDETFGSFHWRRSHQCMNGSVYCTVEVKDSETGGWVAKQDAGAAGNYEKEKSQASDSFKRACFNWGIEENFIPHRLYGFPLPKQGYIKRGTNIAAGGAFA